MRPALLVAVGVGLLGVSVIVGGVVLSYWKTPNYHLWQRFISDLAHRRAPGADFLNGGFIVGGALVGLGLGAVSLLLLRADAVSWRLRVATFLGSVSAWCLLLVGIYPIYTGLSHVVAALSAILFGTVAGIIAALELSKHSTTSRWVGRCAAGLIGMQIAFVLIAIGVALYLIDAGRLDSRELFYSGAALVTNPFSGSSFINPIAIAEWVIFGTTVVLLGGVLLLVPRLSATGSEDR